MCVFFLMCDNFASYSGGRVDLEKISGASKIIRQKSIKIPFAGKPQDFCSLFHHFIEADGTQYLLSKSVDHKDAPLDDEYNRSEIVFAVNIFKPLEEDVSKTQYTSISHMRYVGLSPMLVWNSCYQGAVRCLKELKEALPKIDSKQ